MGSAMIDENEAGEKKQSIRELLWYLEHSSIIFHKTMAFFIEYMSENGRLIHLELAKKNCGPVPGE